jgi:hypothetical protein
LIIIPKSLAVRGFFLLILRALAAAIVPELETNFFMSPASNCYIPEISFFCNTAINCNISETQLISATAIATFQRLFLQHHLQHSLEMISATFQR